MNLIIMYRFIQLIKVATNFNHNCKKFSENHTSQLYLLFSCTVQLVPAKYLLYCQYWLLLIQLYLMYLPIIKTKIVNLYSLC